MSGHYAEFEKEVKLMDQMATFGLYEADIEEIFDPDTTGVMLFHRPSELRIKCHATPDRTKNRLLARQLLLDKIQKGQKITSKPDRAKVRHISLAIALFFLFFILIFFLIIGLLC